VVALREDPGPAAGEMMEFCDTLFRLKKKLFFCEDEPLLCAKDELDEMIDSRETAELSKFCEPDEPP